MRLFTPGEYFPHEHERLSAYVPSVAVRCTGLWAGGRCRRRGVVHDAAAGWRCEACADGRFGSRPAVIRT